MFERLAKALIRLRICTGCSEALLGAHTTLLETSSRGSYSFMCIIFPVKDFLHKILIIVLIINLNMWFVCSKEPSH